MIRFGIKSCIAVGAAYYLADQGVWKDSQQSSKLYTQICTAVTPYLKEVGTQLPVEVPQLPERNQLSYIAKQAWNKGVSVTFTFLGDLPQHLYSWTTKGINAAKANPEIKKFIDSFPYASIGKEQK